MPLPEPQNQEQKKKFLQRCMLDKEVSKEFKDVKQRYAVCINLWSDKKNGK